MRNIFGDGKYVFAEEKINSRDIGGIFGEGKYVFFAEEKNNREGKEGGSFARARSIQMIICKRLVDPDEHL